MPQSVLRTCRGVVLKCTGGVERVVQLCAFWTAAILPLGYIPLLLFAPSKLLTLGVFGKLLTLNLVALILGRGYAADSEDE